jgi:hypothetical protein
VGEGAVIGGAGASRETTEGNAIAGEEVVEAIEDAMQDGPFGGGE